jgi:lysozyme
MTVLEQVRDQLEAALALIESEIARDRPADPLKRFFPYLIAALKKDEGFRTNAYPDPLSGGDPWTIGYGATGPGIRKGTMWTQEQADEALARMALEHGQELERAHPWIASLDDVRRSVLWNMAYNLGVPGLLKFVNTLGYVKAGQFDHAASGMLASKWAKQVKGRAVRLAEEMRTGRLA